MQRGNSAASRDIAYHLHPYTNLKKHESDGPLVITEGKGIHVSDESGKEYIEGMAGLWCTSLGFGEERLVEAATRQMRRLPYYHVFANKSHDVVRRAGRAARRHDAGADVEGLLQQFRLGGQRHRRSRWSGTTTTPWAGTARRRSSRACKGYHGVTVATASLTGLPTNHRDFDLPIANIRHADCPHHYRYGKPGESEEEFATRLAESLEAADPARGSRDRGRLHRRAGDGRRRRHPPARDLFREDPEGPQEARRAADRRRGDLRLRPHRQHVRLRDLSASSPTSSPWPRRSPRPICRSRRPIISEEIYQALRAARARRSASSPTATPIPAHPGVLRGGARDAEDLRGARHPRPCPGGRAALPARACAICRPSAGRRGARRRPGRPASSWCATRRRRRRSTPRGRGGGAMAQPRARSTASSSAPSATRSRSARRSSSPEEEIDEVQARFARGARRGRCQP